MRSVFLFFYLFCTLRLVSLAQGNAFVPNDKYDSLRIMLVGDIMQNNGQIAAVYDNSNRYYDYSNTFRFVQPLFGVSDVVIGNLETTFSGRPYSSNPFFSAPDEFALALKYAGFNCLMTANDHCADRDKEGMTRTIHLLDSIGISHTGTFLNRENKFLNNPLLIQRNGFSIAILNYTFGTKYNVADTNMVNLINPEKIKGDLFATQKLNPDFTIVYLHWGTEYERFPSDNQRELAKLCFDNGADFVAGSNPHVLQKAEEIQFLSYGASKKGFVAYSLGNFISDYDRRYGDGAAIMEVILTKEKKTGMTKVSDFGFIPTYVIKEGSKNNKLMQVVPVSEVESKNISVDMSSADLEKMRLSGLDSRSMMNTSNCLESKYKLNDDIISDVSETIVLTGAPVNIDKKTDVFFAQKKTIVNTIQVAKTEVKNEILVETKTTVIRGIETGLNSTINVPVKKVVVNQIDLTITNEERKKDSLVETNKRNVFAINTTKPIVVLSKSPTIIAKLDTFLSNDVREKESIVLSNKTNFSSIGIKQSIPAVVKNSVVSSKVEHVITNDTIALHPKPIIVPPERSIEDDILDLENKFKKYGAISYKVKFYDMPTKIEINTYYYKYLEGYASIQENGNWVYYLGNSASFEEAKTRCMMLRGKGLKKITIIPFVNGKKIDWTINY